MDNTKLLLCHNHYIHPGGESLVFENELNGLRKRGHSVSLYLRSNQETEHLPLHQRIRLFLSAYYSLQTRREVTNLLKREKSDVALVQNVFPVISPSLYTTLSEMQIPVIQAVYNYRFICPQGELFTQGQICERCVKGEFFNAVRYRCYRNSYLTSAWYGSILGIHRALKTIRDSVDIFMVPDHFLGKKLIESGIPAEKIRRNPNPFFAEDFQPNLETDGYFLFVGRLVRQKGILTLIEAVRQADRRVRLVIVGRGEAQEQVEELIVRYGLSDRISFLGPKWGQEVEELIRRSKAVVIPSEWYDNLPLILCQANACGKPVIASRINGIPEYVTEGENGFLFESGNPQALAEVMNQVASISGKAYHALSLTARKTAEDVFDYSNHYQILTDIFHSVLR